MTPFRDLCRNRDVPAIVAVLSERYAHPMDPDKVAKVCEQITDERPCRSWADDTWFMWWGNRVAFFAPEAVAGRHPRIGLQEGVEPCYNELHVFFLDIVETPEQLARLAVEDTPGLRRAREARSKIGRTAQNITPIDAVAWRVAPMPEELNR